MMKRITHIALILFVLSLVLVTPISAKGDNHVFNYSYIECNGRRIPKFWLRIIQIVTPKTYRTCIIEGRTIHSQTSSLDTTPLRSPSAPPSHTFESDTFSPTPTPSISEHPTASPTPTPVILTPPISNPGNQPNQLWHDVDDHDGLNIHEHGDKPPSWADEFSIANFGHPVIFGGDEATSNENILKHQAFKGFIMNASGVDLYIRYHAMSNPMGRSGPLHSYEVYAKDSSNKVSFWQGWVFHGYPEHRDQRMSRRNEQPGFDPLSGITWPGRNQFIISGSDLVDWKNYLTCEQWYGHGGLWSWDLSITICSATTYYSVDEHLTNVADRSTWKPTGALGGNRRLEVSHYGPSNPSITGENLPFDKWFCAKKLPNEDRSDGTTPTWDLTGAVSVPSACPEGFLPQFVSSTFPKKGVYFRTGNTHEKDFPTTGVTLPN